MASLSPTTSSDPLSPLSSDPDRPILDYHEDMDGDGLGAGPPHPQGQQLLGWVDNNRDQCPVQPGPSENAGCPVAPPLPEGVPPDGPAAAGSVVPPEAPPPGL